MLSSAKFGKITKTVVSSIVTVVIFSKIQVAQTPNISDIYLFYGQKERVTANQTMSTKLQKAKAEALWGMFVADALSMPVHWYYNPDDIKDGYDGWLTGYRAPEKRHPSSILSLSAVDGSGRNGWHDKSKPVIGHVILHDKLKYWTSRDSSVHYHQGMKAGDNTLNSLTALQILKTMNRVDPVSTMSPRELRGIVLEDYVKFMTTPGSHNDTYAESFHRAFFRDWVLESNPPTSAEDLLVWAEKRYQSRKGSDSQLVVIGALVPAIPWIVHYAERPEDECVKATAEFIKLTHPEKSLVPFVEIYASLLHRVLNGRNLKEEIQVMLSHKKLGGTSKKKAVETLLEKASQYPAGSEKRLQMYQMATGRLGSACYIEGALSSLMFLALEFSDSPNEGLLANANCGGENCHRGAALGALLGASAGWKSTEISQHYKDGLGSAREGLTLILDRM